MKRHLNESNYSSNAVCINITKLKEDYPDLLANDVRDILLLNGATVTGENKGGFTYMFIDNVPLTEIINAFDIEFNVQNIEDYFCQLGQKVALDLERSKRAANNRDFRYRDTRDSLDYPAYDDVDTYPDYDDVDIEQYVDESRSSSYRRHVNEAAKRTYKSYDDSKLQECINKIKEAEEMDADLTEGNDKAYFRKLRKVSECCSKLESYCAKKLKECNAKNLKECCKRLKECSEKLDECSEKLAECKNTLNERNCKFCGKVMKECCSKIKECCEKIDRCNKKLKECNESRVYRNMNFKAVFEKRKGCCPPKRKAERTLYEALKAFDKKDQTKLNDIEKNIRAASKFKPTEDEAKAAFAKLKKELSALSKIKKDANSKFTIADVKGIKTILNKIQKNAPSEAKEIKKFLDKVDAALNEGKRTLNDNTKINGKSMNRCTNRELKECLLKLKKIVSNLNESKADIDKIETFKKCIRRIQEELTYRAIYGKLFEDETLSDDELAKMFGAPQGEEDPKDDEDSKEGSEEEEEEVMLARIEITMKNKKAAEDLKQACLDADIPEDAIEISAADEDEEEFEEDEEGEETEGEEGSEEEGSEEGEETEGEEEGSEEGDETPNESIRYKNLARLLNEGEEGGDEGSEDEGSEDEGSEEGDDAEGSEEGDKTEGEEGDEESEDDGKQYVFKLIDTDYTEDLQKILDDNYGITKEEFEEMIGGEITKEDDEDSEDGDDEDSDEDSEEGDDKDEKKDDKKKKEGDDDIEVNPEDLFKGL